MKDGKVDVSRVAPVLAETVDAVAELGFGETWRSATPVGEIKLVPIL